MKECAFCELPEIKNREIIRNAFARAFLTNRPIVPGHTIIIPTRCVLKYEELNEKEKESIEKLRNVVIMGLKKSFKAEGFNFSWNDGVHAGQTVAHFHLHIIPRTEGDTGIYQYEPRQFLYRPSSQRKQSSEKELAEITDIIKNNLR